MNAKGNIFVRTVLLLLSCQKSDNNSLKQPLSELQIPLQFVDWCRFPVLSSVLMQSQTHPSVVYIHDTLMHYIIWIATTPYPKRNITFENPYIYFNNSSSYINFSPIKFNPTHDRPLAPNFYNSDVDILYFNHRLYSIIRASWNGKYAREIKVRSSIDSQKWSDAVHVYSSNYVKGKDLLSPSIINYENEFYIYHLNENSDNDPTAKCLGIEIMKRACKLFTFKSMIMFLCEFHTPLNKKIIIV